MYSRKDYVAVAALLRRQRGNAARIAPWEGGDDTSRALLGHCNMHHQRGGVEAVDRIISEFAQMFQADNPRFDWRRFMEAAGFRSEEARQEEEV